MGLGGALEIGRTGILTAQRAIEVVGNNLANVATEGYHRQVANLEPIRNQEIQSGLFVGRGVQLESIVRQVNEALEGRIRTAIAEQSGSQVRQEVLTQVEALHNEYTDADLSTQLNDFFSAWSELANNPRDSSIRGLVVREADTMASFVRDLRGGLSELRIQVDNDISAAADHVNELLDRIAQVDAQVVAASSGTTGAPGLRDQRDLLLTELAQYLDISVNQQSSGSVDVYVGSTPVLLNGINRGVTVRQTPVENDLQIDLVLKADGTVLNPSTGRIGSLMDAREEDVNGTINELDDFVNTLMFEVNKIHSQGQALQGFDEVISSKRIKDASLAINNLDNGLDFTAQHGSFQLHITQKSTGLRNTHTIDIDLDGIDPANDTTVNDLISQLDGLDEITASLQPDGRIKLSADSSDFEISFSDDSSHVLAALGINTFFSGGDASDIAVNQVVKQNTDLIAAAQGHVTGDNSNALALAQLRETRIPGQGNLSITELWNRHVEDVAVKLGQTRTQLDADQLVLTSLKSQQQSTSGVNADEEVINLLSLQRAYQGSARFLQVVDELMQTLMSLV